MRNISLYPILTYLIAGIWLVNGLLCKVLDLVPRHERIVAAILGAPFSREFTLFIGIAEIIMAIWICSGYQSRLNAIGQITIILSMNLLEALLVPDLLLWGYMNIVYASIFCGVIYYWGFVLKAKEKRKRI
ncbi:DoxX-like family protein [Sphingobacterium sp. lm-10]|uniref:DoxX-like family protein n=1 Tax=Sphingobacterium sp. lm-10 TaxID=2944904 RepID=UPI002021CC20|nr:DoxX-like family protein [Sphingobacterium sp. lm-10]